MATKWVAQMPEPPATAATPSQTARSSRVALRA